MPVIGRRLQLAMLCKLVLSKSDFLCDSVIARRHCGEVFAAVNSPERHKEPLRHRETQTSRPRSNDLQSNLTNLRSANLTVGRLYACATEYNSALAGKTSRYARGKLLCGMWRTTRAKGLARTARWPAVRSLRTETRHACFVSIINRDRAN